ADQVVITREDILSILIASSSLDKSYLGISSEVVECRNNLGIWYLFSNIANSINIKEDCDDSDCDLSTTINELVVETYYDTTVAEYKYITYPANEIIINKNEYLKTLTKHNVFNFSNEVKELYRSFHNDKVIFNYTSGQYSNTEIYCIGFIAKENIVRISIIDIFTHDTIEYAIEFSNASEIKSTDIFRIKLVQLSESKFGLVYSYRPNEVDYNVSKYNDTRTCIVVNEDLTRVTAIAKVNDIIKYLT
ncbi:MAG: hypothetical protein JHC33_05720, partial [Ignisphaera sp.]|nr:hypothetical protein [Ignisphaera sp.]